MLKIKKTPIVVNDSRGFYTSRPEGPSARLLTGLCAREGFEPNVTFRVNDCQMTKAMVAAGEGVSLIPNLMLDATPGDVVIRPIERHGIARRVAAVRLRDRYLSPASEAFLDELRRAAAEHAGGGWPTQAA